jgi:L,D-transpeptidase ErfK/SrfK
MTPKYIPLPTQSLEVHDRIDPLEVYRNTIGSQLQGPIEGNTATEKINPLDVIQSSIGSKLDPYSEFTNPPKISNLPSPQDTRLDQILSMVKPQAPSPNLSESPDIKFSQSKLSVPKEALASLNIPDHQEALGIKASPQVTKALPQVFDNETPIHHVTQTTTSNILGQHLAPARSKDPAAAPERQIIVSTADKKLVVEENGKIIKQYPVMIGDKSEPTPLGQFRILEQTPWNGSVMGKAWMGFFDDAKTKNYFGIHGFGPEHDPEGTGGCVALRNEDVLDLYKLVHKGTKVNIVDKPYSTGTPLPPVDWHKISNILYSRFRKKQGNVVGE